jgi:hypothetical protein
MLGRRGAAAAAEVSDAGCTTRKSILEGGLAMPFVVVGRGDCYLVAATLFCFLVVVVAACGVLYEFHTAPHTFDRPPC